MALVPNLPFLVDAPAAFVASVLAPLGDLPADGVGLVRFALAGALPQLPRAVPVLKRAASCLARIVIPLFAVPDADAPDMARLIDERRVAMRANELWRLQGRRGRLASAVRFGERDVVLRR